MRLPWSLAMISTFGESSVQTAQQEYVVPRSMPWSPCQSSVLHRGPCRQARSAATRLVFSPPQLPCRSSQQVHVAQQRQQTDRRVSQQPSPPDGQWRLTYDGTVVGSVRHGLDVYISAMASAPDLVPSGRVVKTLPPSSKAHRTVPYRTARPYLGCYHSTPTYRHRH